MTCVSGLDQVRRGGRNSDTMHCYPLVWCALCLWVPCAGYMFGGRAAYIRAVAAVFEVVIEDALSHGHLSGIDGFLTVIHNQFSELVRAACVGVQSIS